MRTPILGGEKRTTTVETTTDTGLAGHGPAGASTVSVPAANADADAAEAYERGRADALRADATSRERAKVEPTVVRPRRRGFPLLSLILLILAAIGAAWIYLSITQGSAQQGGAVVDDKINAATAPARHAVDNVRNTTGQAVENAGDALKNSGERIKKP